MVSINNFARQSLELNLFFLRLMKEHSLFLVAGFLPKNSDYINEALVYHNELNQLLKRAVELAKGVVEITNEDVTDYTMESEKAVSKLTGIPIDTALTKAELDLKNQSLNRINDSTLENDVRSLNERSINSVKNLIRFKTRLLNDMLACDIMYHHYPTFVEHNRLEAMLFVDVLSNYQNNNLNYYNDLVNNEVFWNHIMEEHSKFIRGLLDPCEDDLFNVADEFANTFTTLLAKSHSALNNPSLVPELTRESYSATKKLNAFKQQATVSLLSCELKSMLDPLAADHVLRESYHYLRLLESVRRKY